MTRAVLSDNRIRDIDEVRKLVSRYLSTVRVAGSFGRLADAAVRDLGDKDLPLRYYRRDRLLSLEARMRWVESDLQEI